MLPLKPAALAIVFFLSACASPQCDHPARHNLTPAENIRPAVVTDARYATRNNFTGERLYPSDQLWLHRDTARALSRAQADLAKQGLRLKIYDAYRPLPVQQRMWDLIRDERYVSNPAKNLGRHTRGTAVDVTLVDSCGRELDMPTGFDNFTERAHADYPGVTAAQRRNRKTLARAMTRHGFIPYPFEWWHFDLKGWEKYPVLSIVPQASPGATR